LQTSPEGTIRAEEIWKRFRADRRRAQVQDQLQRVTDRVKGRASGRGWRWALRDVELDLQPGSSVGLIGANGSGKTTLLKILTRVMYPTAGNVEVNGRVGALLAISAGIHPNLTGRENILVTGSLMGLPRREVAKRFDEMVAFAELEDAIDRQAKYYSAGMLTRLGFAVAAFLEPDVLLVDEVLAVGDATFQQRCLDRMRYVLSQGTTLVFVSHDLAAVEATCSDGVWLHNGEVVNTGPVREVLSRYRQAVESRAEQQLAVAGRVAVRSVSALPVGDGLVRTDEGLRIELELESDSDYRGWIYVGVSEGTANPIFVVNPGRETPIGAGRTRVSCVLPRTPLPRGRFSLWVGIYDKWTDGEELLGWQPLAQFDVYGPELDRAPRAVVRLSPVYVDSSWSVERA